MGISFYFFYNILNTEVGATTNFTTTLTATYKPKMQF